MYEFPSFLPSFLPSFRFLSGPLILLLFFCIPLEAQRPGVGQFEFELEEVEIDRPPIRVNQSPCFQYTEPGSTVDLWDWRTTTYTVVFFQDNENLPATRIVDSPFFYPGVNINHLGFLNNEAQDFEPSDGWELLYLNLGTTERPVEEPSFSLYNRLDGRFRIFFYVEPNNGGGPDNVLVRISNVAGTVVPNATSLFENLNIPQNALNNFDKVRSLDGIAQFNEGEAGLEWYLLEGVIGYDPCVCQYASALEVQPILTDVTNLNFSLDGGGTSQAMYEPKDPFSALGYFGDLTGTIASGLKKYKDATSYKADADSTKDKTVKTISNVIGGIFGGATGVLDLLGFITGKKSSSVAPKLTGFNHNFSFTANGTEENPDGYDTHFFYTPGSFYDVNQLEAFRPIYDNPLGVFAVLETPVVERQDDLFVKEGTAPYFETTETNRIRWRFAGGLQYHINSLAGIADRPVELMASLVWTDCENQADFYATPAINITCLEDFVVEFEDIYSSVTDPGTGEDYDSQNFVGCDSEPQLQIVAVLRSAAPSPGQDILYSARYRTTTRKVATGTIGDNPYAGLSIEEINNSCNGSIPRPLPDFLLGDFCEQQYDPTVSRRRSEVEGDRPSQTTESDQITFTAYPNPFSNQISVVTKPAWGRESLHLELYDILGRKVWSRTGLTAANEEVLLTTGLTDLPVGTYTLKVSGKTFTETLTIQKQ